MPSAECCFIDYVAADPCAAIAAGAFTIHNCHLLGMSPGEFIILAALCA